MINHRPQGPDKPALGARKVQMPPPGKVGQLELAARGLARLPWKAQGTGQQKQASGPVDAGQPEGRC